MYLLSIFMVASSQVIVWLGSRPRGGLPAGAFVLTVPELLQLQNLRGAEELLVVVVEFVPPLPEVVKLEAPADKLL